VANRNISVEPPHDTRAVPAGFSLESRQRRFFAFRQRGLEERPNVEFFLERGEQQNRACPAPKLLALHQLARLRRSQRTSLGRDLGEQVQDPHAEGGL